MLRIAIIADDLTGANDTGVQFCHHGFNTLVIIDPASINDLNVHPGKVLSINTNSRSMKADEAYTAVYNIAEILRNKKISHLYKKIDSTLRGNPGVELDALMDASQAPLGLVIPSFPANGRIVRDGNLYVMNTISSSRLPSAELNMKTHCYIPEVLKQQMKRKVGLIELENVRKGTEQLLEAIQQAQKEYEVLVIDAVTEKDLENIACAIKSLSKSIIAGSAGFASYIDLSWNVKGNPCKQTIKKIPDDGVTLFVAGSRNPITTQQIDELSKVTNCVPVALNPAAMIDIEQRKQEIERVMKIILNNLYYSNTVIITVGNQMAVSEGYVKIGSIIAKTIGTIVNQLSLILNIKGLIIAGGDTALNICNSLDVAGINLVTELLDGIPFGYLYGKKLDGLPIVTKAGGFGTPDAFVKIYNMFSEFDNNAEGIQLL